MDTGASVNVLYWNVFLNLQQQKEDLQLTKTSITGFGQRDIDIAGIISFPVTFGDHAKEKTINVTFTLV